MWYLVILAFVIGAMFGVLFGRKNKAIADKLAAEAKVLQTKAEAELAALKAKVTDTTKSS